MMLIFNEQMGWAKHTFGFSLFLLMLSLALSVYEIQISVEAIKIQLSDLEVRKMKKYKKSKQVAKEESTEDDSPGGGLQGNYDG